MTASVKFDLWFFNTPQMETFMEQEGTITALGVILQLFRYLRLCHNAVGNRRSLRKIARECNCSEEWLWRVVTNYDLFIVDDDEQFFSPYLSDLLHTDKKPAPSRTPRHAQNCAAALYNEDNHDKKDNHDNDDKENKELYLGYDRSYGGRRYGYRGEPIPADAPEQTNQDTRWSWIHHQWVPRARWCLKREKKEYERTTRRKWQTIASGQ